jgi:amidase
VANGNVVIRHLGIPTVTVPMGNMSDIGMPVGLTFAGRGYDDTNLLAMASAFDRRLIGRVPPPRTPELEGDAWVDRGTVGQAELSIELTVSAGEAVNGHIPIRIDVNTNASQVAVSVNGVACAGEVTPTGFSVETSVSESEHSRVHSEWRGGYGSVVVAMARSESGVVGEYAIVGGVA